MDTMPKISPNNYIQKRREDLLKKHQVIRISGTDNISASQILSKFRSLISMD